MVSKAMNTSSLILFALLGMAAAATSSSNDVASEQFETFSLDDETGIGRTFVTVNGSNIVTTPNFVVGITLIGISLALLFGSAASAASVAAASSLAAGGIPGKYKRSLPDFATDPTTLFKTLATAEQHLKNFDVTDVECRKRIICEIHQDAPASSPAAEVGSLRGSLGNIANVVLDTFNNLDVIGDGKYPFLKQYLEAAENGKSKQECSQVYNTCQYSVKNILRNLSF